MDPQRFAAGELDPREMRLIEGGARIWRPGYAGTGEPEPEPTPEPVV